MSDAAHALHGEQPLTTADGRPLKAALARALRRRRMRAVLLVMPLMIFVGATFLYPIALMLFRSVENPLIAENMPRTLNALQSWDGKEVPDEAAFAALAADFVEARKNETIGRLATRLNFETSGLWSAGAISDIAVVFCVADWPW